MRAVALCAILAEQPGEEVDVLADAEVCVEIGAEPLRHVGDPRANRAPVALLGHIAIEHP